MAIRRHGVPNGFWGNNDGSAEHTGPNGFSRMQFLGQAVSNVAIFVTVNQPTTITVQTAHSAALTADGTDPDVENPPATWGGLYFWNSPNTAITMTMVSGTNALNLSGFAPGWLRLESSNDVLAYAGYEVSSY